MSSSNELTSKETFAKDGHAILAATALLKGSKPLTIERLSLRPFLWCSHDKQVQVFLDHCPQQAAQLSLRKVVARTIKCPFDEGPFNDLSFGNK